MSDNIFIGLGSNLDQPIQQILTAIEQLKNLPQCEVKNISSLYETPPMGPQDQPYYINAVVKISTSLAPLELLSALQTIETSQGRTKDTGRWGARTIDLDILLYDDNVSNSPTLTIPHPSLALRTFVLYPLRELEEELNIPSLGSIKFLIKQLCELPPKKIRAELVEK